MTARPRILLLETIHDQAMADLERATDVTPAWSLDDAATIERAQSGPFDAIVTRGKGQVTAALMDACHGLRAVVRCGVGLDNIDCEAVASRGITVLNLPGCNAQTMTEHAIMLILSVMRGLVDSAVAVQQGDWASRAHFDRDEVFGKTVGVVGLGNIGARVADVCSALGMNVIFTDPASPKSRHEQVTFDDLLARADVITLHCQLDETTRGLIDGRTLARMRPGVILINTARGGLVEHDALAEQIRNGHVAGYGADVLDVEPPAPDMPLLGLAHVVVTPHVGSLTRSTYREICVDSVRNLLKFLAV